jgi:glycosyl transferase family 2
MARILVGIPCFRLADQVRQCLNSLTPADIVAVDNAADQDVKSVLGSFPNITVLHSPTNEYCNGGWNRILEYGLAREYDIIGLGSSDASLHPGWEPILQERTRDHNDEVWIPRIGKPFLGTEVCQGGVAGFFSFWPRKAAELVYPIPRQLKHWYGDQWCFERARAAGWKVTILNNLCAEHAWSAVTAANPETYAVIEQDKIEWGRLGL